MNQTNTPSSFLGKLLPVVFAFFIMGFIDVVGIAAGYIRADFVPDATPARAMPFMIYLWFLVFSIPAAVFMGRIGRKNTVIISMVFMALAFLLPLFVYDMTFCMIAFALMGVGNAILQVSLNPLVSNVVAGERLAGSLALGQGVKSLAWFLGPVMAAFAASSFGDWKLIFPVYAAITAVATLWLAFTRIPEQQPLENRSTVRGTLSLLKDRRILMLFFGIFAIAGIDAGMRMSMPEVLAERAGLLPSDAAEGLRTYVLARAAGAFLGALLMLRFSPRIVLVCSVIAAAAAYAIMMGGAGEYVVLVSIAAVGFFCANIFAILFAEAMGCVPDKGSQVSGLMITGVSGGAVIPMLMALFARQAGNEAGGMAVIMVCMLYLMVVSIFAAQKTDR